MVHGKGWEFKGFNEVSIPRKEGEPELEEGIFRRTGNMVRAQLRAEEEREEDAIHGRNIGGACVLLFVG